MNVQPDFIDHPKTQFLRRALGEHGARAHEFVLRLWGHCQNNQRGEDWGKVTAEYVEMVCHWPGGAGVLFDALCKGMLPGKCGFAEVKGGRFIVHEWNTHNAKLVGNWTRNPNGRRGVGGGESTAKPIGSIGEAMGSRTVPPGGSNKRGVEKIRGDRRRGEGTGSRPALHTAPLRLDAEAFEVNCPPTKEAVLAHGRKKNWPEKSCTRFWVWHQGKGWKGLKDFRPHLEEWVAQDTVKNAPEGSGAGVSMTPAEELEQIKAELQHVSDPARIEQLKKRRGELTGK